MKKIQSNEIPVIPLSEWIWEGKHYWIIKIGDNDYSLFDGTNVIEVTFSSERKAEKLMRKLKASKVFRIK